MCIQYSYVFVLVYMCVNICVYSISDTLEGSLVPLSSQYPTQAIDTLCCFPLQGHNVLLSIHLRLGGLFTAQGDLV